MTTKQNVDVLWFMGQSNMQGQTEKLTENNAEIENSFEYRFFQDELVPLKNPVGEHVLRDMTEGWQAPKGCVADTVREWQRAHALGASAEGNTNMVPCFCKAYTRITNKKVVAVHTAKGATVVKEWLPDDTVYNAAWTKMRAALTLVRENFTVDNIYMVWLQGESDALNGTSRQDYIKMMIDLKNNAKKDFGINKFGIIKVGNFALDYRDEVIKDAQEALPNLDSDFVMLSRITEDFMKDNSFMNPLHRGHYNSDGQEKIGLHAGSNLANITLNKPPLYK